MCHIYHGKYGSWNSDDNFISWGPEKNKISSIYSGEKNPGSGFTGPRPKNHDEMDAGTNLW